MTPARLAPVLALGLALAPAACGGAQRAPDGDAAHGAGASADPRTPIERRRDAACDALAPRITACAVADARADLASGKIDQRQFDHDTTPDRQHQLTAAWLEDCKAARYSSRQIRVLEVCPRAETQCGPLLACLDHLHDQAPGQASAPSP